MNAWPACPMVGSPIRSLGDFSHLIQLSRITDEWSQAFSVVREHRLGRVFVAPLDLVIRRDPLRTRQAEGPDEIEAHDAKCMNTVGRDLFPLSRWAKRYPHFVVSEGEGA